MNIRLIRLWFWIIYHTNIISFLRLRQVHEIKVKCGWITNDAQPLRCCKCHSRKFKETDANRIEGQIIKYTLICKDCNNIVGTWAYGHWIH